MTDHSEETKKLVQAAYQQGHLVGFVTGRAHERAMLKVLCEGAISSLFNKLEALVPAENNEVTER
jgi:hydroxymethylpyrimidine pyrophosphatase-like HAD family hydrolase